MLITNGSTPVIVFLMVDATDDETAKTGLSPSVQISRNGAAFASVTNAVSEISNGWYKVTLTATETNTDGPLIMRATGASADEWRDIHQVVTTVPANVVSMAADTLTSSALAASAVSEIQTGLSTLDAAAVRTALGLASANLDTQLSTISGYVDTEVAAIKAKTDNLPANPAAVGSAMTLTSGERDSVAAALLDLANGVETGYTLRQVLRILAAAMGGKLSGAATTTVAIRSITDSKDRITATVDSDGNRSAVTLDAS